MGPFYFTKIITHDPFAVTDGSQWFSMCACSGGSMQFIKLRKMHLCLVLNVSTTGLWVGSLVSDVLVLNCGGTFKRWSIVGGEVQILSFLGISVGFSKWLSFLRASCCYKAHACPCHMWLIPFQILLWCGGTGRGLSPEAEQLTLPNLRSLARNCELNRFYL